MTEKKKAAPAAAKSGPRRSLYLPALPEGYQYDSVAVSGPDGERIDLLRTTDGASLAAEGAGIEGSTAHASMGDGAKALGRAARAMTEVTKREAELAATRKAALGG